MLNRLSPITAIELFSFYAEAAKAFAVVRTGERRSYGTDSDQGRGSAHLNPGFRLLAEHDFLCQLHQAGERLLSVRGMTILGMLETGAGKRGYGIA